MPRTPRTLAPLATALALAGAPAVAAADTPTESPATTTARAAPATYSFGARVGGYGFRRTGANADGDVNQWDECRMNGIGVFGARAFGRHLFVETALDMYFSQDFPTGGAPDDLPIDRVSGLVTAAAGLRANATRWLAGYAQLGVGVELTQVSVPYADHEITDRLAMPMGFVGIGGDIKLGAKTYLGANFRFNVMGNFDYDPAKLEMETGWTTPPSADEVFDPSPDLAAQGQFFLRREL
jgi:hypothetical protein